MDTQLQLPEDVHTALQAAAEEDGNTVDTELVTAVKDFLERRQAQKVLERVKMTTERDASLLARLAE
ncbi:CopG family transcriptional regulator [Nocardiopsis sp. YSL2]|uniref:CopG family transcriptional regulator n=1 Tax=Nocardiopsis sp. YSL2 TaxID=2939492 RepID=UPI0026F42F37|nr:CopG family transcriptional regulator [Nocardiopsis sp. YSL2]